MTLFLDGPLEGVNFISFWLYINDVNTEITYSIYEI